MVEISTASKNELLTDVHWYFIASQAKLAAWKRGWVEVSLWVSSDGQTPLFFKFAALQGSLIIAPCDLNSLSVDVEIKATSKDQLNY